MGEMKCCVSGNPSPSFVQKPTHPLGQWPGDPQLMGSPRGSDIEYRGSDQPTTLSSVQPDVTLQTPEYKGTARYGQGIFSPFFTQN